VDISVIALSLAALIVIALISHHRTAARELEIRRLKEESQQKIAAATVRIARANQSAAAAEREREQLKNENLELAIALERERKQRQEVEERIAQLAASGAAAGRRCEPRVITEEHAAAIAAGMRRFSGQRVTLIQLSDPEACALAEQLRQTLEDAQWDVVVSRVESLVPPQRGIIVTHAKEDSAAAELVAALRTFGLIVYERTEPMPQLQIIVGLQP
jgi:septal ring factor EnvC (AmiA/AmiB activator)